jgi:hypothetical protein
MINALSHVLLLVLLGQEGQLPSAADVPVLTVREVLQNRERYNGKSVVVVGRLVGTMEGAWLDQEPANRITIDGNQWGFIISLTYVVGEVEPPPSLPKDFKWDRKLLYKKLSEVQKTTKLEVIQPHEYRERWSAIFGRFETSIPLSEGNAFGHLNGSPAQLISDYGKSFHELKAQ